MNAGGETLRTTGISSLGQETIPQFPTLPYLSGSNLAENGNPILPADVVCKETWVRLSGLTKLWLFSATFMMVPACGHAQSMDIALPFTWRSNGVTQKSATTFALELATSEASYTATTIPTSSYQFSFDYRGLTAAGLRLAVFDETHGDWIEDQFLYAAAPLWEWTTITYEFTVPEGCVSVRLYPIRGVTRPGLVDLRNFQMTPADIETKIAYFVDSVAGSDTYDGRSPEKPWKTLSRVNTAPLEPGDVVALHRGQIWREELKLNVNGTPDAPISFISYGLGMKPVISGGDLLTAWQPSSESMIPENVWETPFAARPLFVRLDGTSFDMASSLSTIDAKTPWYWANGKVYLYSPTNPLTAFNRPGIEAASRNECVYTYYSSNVTFTSLHLDMANSYGLFIDGTSFNITVTDTDISYPGQFGLLGNSAYMTSNVTFANGIVHHAGAGGLYANPNSINWTFTDSELYQNGYIDGLDELRWGGNVRIGGFGTTCGPHAFLNLLLHDAGYKDDHTRVTSQDRKGFGIWFDTVDQEASILQNVISYNNADSGIFIEKSKRIQVQNALAIGNGQYGLRIDADDQGFVAQNQVSFLTAYGNDIGIYVAGGYLQASLSCVHNIIQECIASGNRSRELSVKWGADNGGRTGIGNYYQHNCFGFERPGFIEWGSDHIVDTYHALASLYGGAMDNVENDPIFTDPDKGDFRLSPNSPAATLGFGAH